MGENVQSVLTVPAGSATVVARKNATAAGEPEHVVSAWEVDTFPAEELAVLVTAQGFAINA